MISVESQSSQALIPETTDKFADATSDQFTGQTNSDVSGIGYDNLNHEQILALISSLPNLDTKNPENGPPDKIETPKSEAQAPAELKEGNLDLTEEQTADFETIHSEKGWRFYNRNDDGSLDLWNDKKNVSFKDSMLNSPDFDLNLINIKDSELLNEIIQNVYSNGEFIYTNYLDADGLTGKVKIRLEENGSVSMTWLLNDPSKKEDDPEPATNKQDQPVQSPGQKQENILAPTENQEAKPTSGQKIPLKMERRSALGIFFRTFFEREEQNAKAAGQHEQDKQKSIQQGSNVSQFFQTLNQNAATENGISVSLQTQTRIETLKAEDSESKPGAKPEQESSLPVLESEHTTEKSAEQSADDETLANEQIPTSKTAVAANIPAKKNAIGRTTRTNIAENPTVLEPANNDHGPTGPDDPQGPQLQITDQEPQPARSYRSYIYERQSIPQHFGQPIERKTGLAIPQRDPRLERGSLDQQLAEVVPAEFMPTEFATETAEPQSVRQKTEQQNSQTLIEQTFSDDAEKIHQEIKSTRQVREILSSFHESQDEFLKPEQGQQQRPIEHATPKIIEPIKIVEPISSSEVINIKPDQEITQNSDRSIISNIYEQNLKERMDFEDSTATGISLEQKSAGNRAISPVPFQSERRGLSPEVRNRATSQATSQEETEQQTASRNRRQRPPESEKFAGIRLAA